MSFKREQTTTNQSRNQIKQKYTLTPRMKGSSCRNTQRHKNKGIRRWLDLMAECEVVCFEENILIHNVRWHWATFRGHPFSMALLYFFEHVTGQFIPPLSVRLTDSDAERRRDFLVCEQVHCTKAGVRTAWETRRLDFVYVRYMYDMEME